RPGLRHEDAAHRHLVRHLGSGRGQPRGRLRHAHRRRVGLAAEGAAAHGDHRLRDRAQANELSRAPHLLRISESTLYRRRVAGRFEPTESDRLWRYLLLYARAVEVHEQPEAAVEWLHAPAAALGGATPLAVSRDGPGLQRALAL